MGRPKGFKMSEEQKARLAEGRKKYFAERKLIQFDKPEKAKKESTRIMSPEHKAALIEGRKKAREQKIANGEPLRKARKRKDVAEIRDGKPVLRMTGKETNAFDFYNPIRDTFRMLKRYNEYNKILVEITDKVYWNNIEWVKNTLSKYVTLEGV